MLKQNKLSRYPGKRQLLTNLTVIELSLPPLKRQIISQESHS